MDPYAEFHGVTPLFHGKQVQPCSGNGVATGRTHRVPLLGEVISIVDEEVTPIHMDEGPKGQVLGPVALLPHQLLASASHMEVLQSLPF